MSFVSFDPKKHKGMQLYQVETVKKDGIYGSVIQPTDDPFESAKLAPWYYLVKASEKKQLTILSPLPEDFQPEVSGKAFSTPDGGMKVVEIFPTLTEPQNCDILEEISQGEKMGGKGSGHHGHKGRPGLRGGSLPRDHYQNWQQIDEKGGRGSGNWGHAGRPGEQGGSAPGGGTHLRGSGHLLGGQGLEGKPTVNKTPTPEQLKRLGLPEDAEFNVFTETVAQIIAEERYDLEVHDKSSYGDQRFELITKPHVTDSMKTVDGKYGDKFYYDPEKTDIVDDEESFHGFRFIPREGVDSITEIADREEGVSLYRGLRDEEIEAIRRSGAIASLGEYNIGERQRGLTYFSVDPRQAESYASGFAPVSARPTFQRPAWIIKVRDPGTGVNFPEQGRDERGVPGGVSVSDITGVYMGVVYAMRSGATEINRYARSNDPFSSGSHRFPVSYVAWIEVPVEDVFGEIGE